MEIDYFTVDEQDFIVNKDLQELEESTNVSADNSIRLPSKQKEIAGKSIAEKQHKCNLCSKSYTTASLLGRHTRDVHKIEYPFKPSFKCSLCNNTFRSRAYFMEHLTAQHCFDIETEHHIFKSREEFRTWKSAIEKEQVSHYVLDNKYTRKSIGKKVEVFSCHRSGEFKSRGKQIRKLKHVGSNKIGCYCPSEIRLEFNDEETELKVNFCLVHLGHECEVPRLRLSKDEKDLIISKLSAGMPPQQVLYDLTKHSCPGSRLSITNSQDLRNILTSYGLKRSDIDCDVNECLDSWVNQVEEGVESSPLLVYKSAGKSSAEYSDLQEQDFCLGFMNDTQEDLFRVFGHELVSIACTNGKNKQNVQLISMVVPDDNWDSLPVAFLWCNRQSENILWHFFHAIHERIGDIETKCFIAEYDHPAFYSSWCRVFEPCNHYLLSKSHVYDSWAKNAEKGLYKIKCIEKREQVMQTLELLINETDVDLSQQHLQNVLHSLSEDPDTKSFHRYFLSNYAACPQLWAECYRTVFAIDANAAVEKWHCSLKYDADLKGKCGGRLDVAIHSLVKSLKTKFLNELDMFNTEKLEKKVTFLRKSHFFAAEFLDSVNILKIGDNAWTVSSFSNSEENLYKVKFLENERCSRKRCILKCASCKACMHEYKCSCLESAIRYSFCEHIHAVCLKNQDSDEVSSLSSDDLSTDLCLSSSELDLEETQHTLNQTSLESSPSLKKEARTAVLNFLSREDLFQSEEQCRNIISTVSSLTRRCEAMGTIFKQMS